MWLIGHTASAYFLVKFLWYLGVKNDDNRKASGAQEDSSTTADEKPRAHFPPGFLLLLFIFANWPDYFHIGFLRYYSHNIFSVFIGPLIVFPVLLRFRVIKRIEAFLLLSASVLHMVTDLLFSSYYTLYPFRGRENSYYDLFGPEYLIFESIISIAFIAVFVRSGESKDLTDFLVRCLNRKWRAAASFFERFFNSYMYIFIFMMFAFFAFIQLLISFRLLLWPSLNFVWFRVMFVLIFFVFVAILTAMFFRFLFKTQKEHHKSQSILIR